MKWLNLNDTLRYLIPDLEFPNKVLQFIDNKIFKYAKTSGYDAAYNSTSRVIERSLNSPDSVAIYLDSIKQLDTKVGPLLTHISLMIAVMAILVSTSALSHFKQGIFFVEIAIYLVTALGCLRVLQPSQPENYSHSDHNTSREKYIAATYREVVIKTLTFSFSNTVTISLTGFMLVTTGPILLI